MVELDSCCFCVPLRTGCLIIGYLNLVVNIIVTIMSILGIGAGLAITASDREDAGSGLVLTAVSAVLLVLVLILLAFTIVLIVGLHKEKPGHVKAYLISALVFLIVNIMLFIVGISMTYSPAGSIIGKLIEFALSIYFLLVIRSHYLRMLDGNKNSA